MAQRWNLHIVIVLLLTSVVALGEGVPGQSAAVGGADAAAAAANAAAASSLAPPCFKIPPNPMACAMMAMALAQMGADSGHEGDAGATQDTAMPTFGVNNSGRSRDEGTEKEETPRAGGVDAVDEEKAKGGDGLSLAQRRQLDKANKILEENGFGIDGNGTVTTPDGKKIPSSAFSSPSSLSDYGLSDSLVEDTKKALDVARNASANFKLKNNGEASGPSGGSKIPLPNIEIEEFDPSKYGFNTASTQVPKSKGSPYYGFSKSFGSDQIGVMGDDIFDMIRRRYTAKKRARAFIPE